MHGGESRGLRPSHGETPGRERAHALAIGAHGVAACPSIKSARLSRCVRGTANG
ncbi:hypothetical protein ATSB10_05220 [Dyella thiooxydans]|uniref:Uncharacterized protein n=1 Tax=Dyella thiooxydans TaxID=445710 RepID=A0A160MXR0_9GAMM|nr:hypothetical protein ATSB10_05220 [Dyella thiooxydans]